MSSPLSSKMRAYLAEVYRLIDRQTQPVDYVTSSQLSDLLFVSPPSVTRMVSKLSEQELLHRQPYQGITLTDSGRIEALKHIRCQRIAEAFLVQVMGIHWIPAHAEAQRLCSSLSEAIVQRMYEMAGEPAFCPHGEPIPDAQGRVTAMNDIPLAQVEADSTARITRLITREADRLQYIEALGLLPGKTCAVIHVAPFDGPMQIRLDREYRIIGNSLAQLIRVQPQPRARRRRRAP